MPTHSIGKMPIQADANREGLVRRHIAMTFCLCLAILGCSGCTLFSGQSKTDKVVFSRQQSLRGMEAIQRGQWEQAENLFAKAVETCPVDERARCRYAETLWHRGAKEEAVFHMQEAVRLSGGDPKLLVQLGEMHYQRDQLGSAMAQANRAIEQDSQLSSAWALRGNIHRLRKQPHLALADYHRALCYQTHYPEVQIAAAEIYSQLNRPQRSLATLQTLADQYAPGEQPQQVLYLQGLALKKMGRYQEAAESFLAATRRDRPHAELLFQLGQSQLMAGDATNAYLSVEQALEIAPQHRQARQLKDSLESSQRSSMAAALRR